MLRLLKILSLFVLIIAGISPASATEPLPDIFFYSGNSMGGIGRLAYNPVTQTYTLANGLITPFVVEQAAEGSIRAMRPDESGGAMAEPSALVAVGSTVTAMVAPYNTLLKLGANGEIIEQAQFGSFIYQGANSRALQTHNGNLFFALNDGTIMAYDTNFKQLGSIKPEQLGWASAGFQIMGDKLYAFGANDPRPAMECAGPGKCGSPYVVAVVIDISNPAAMKIERDEQLPVASVPDYITHHGIDAQQQGWLLVNGNYNGGQQLEWRSMNKPAEIAATLSLTGKKVVALTATAPFYAVIESDEGVTLQSIMFTDNILSLGAPAYLQLKAGHAVGLQRSDNNIFVTSGSQLRVVDVSANPRIAHMQDFIGSAGDMFSFKVFTPVRGLPPAATGANKARIEALLALTYWDDNKQMELENQLSRLTAEDTWALPLLIEKLSQRGGSNQTIHPYLIKGLAGMGAGAVPAIPALLNASMEGAAINGTMALLIAEAIRFIDPVGDETLKAIPAFVSSNYEPGAKHVVRDVLARLSGPAAKSALAEYQ